MSGSQEWILVPLRMISISLKIMIYIYQKEIVETLPRN